MNKPMTRRGCVLGVAVWAVIMTLPICVLVLAVRGELSWRRGPFTEDRVWIVRSDPAAGDETAGLAYSTIRVASGRPGAAGPVCVRTRSTFLLWSGATDNVDYREAYEPGDNGRYQVTGNC